VKILKFIEESYKILMLRFCEEMVALLLKHFKSVKKIREASLEQLAEVVGVSKAGIIRDGLAG
ncbi:MAG: hypothetical protein LBR10_14375, partial [Prevotellaceae bacterium]|nr:hypothetical protein [Prevotellaceae bacterium]